MFVCYSLQQNLEQLKKTAEEKELRLNREIAELKVQGLFFIQLRIKI